MKAALDNAVVGQTVVDLIRDHDNGRTEKKLTAEVRKLVTAVREHRRGGSLTITIDADLVKDDPNRLLITVKPKLKAPEMAPPSDVRYADDDGNLFERDPRQMDLDL